MGEYCLDRQRYISDAALVDSTRSYGLSRVQGIAKNSREIEEKKDKQGMADEQDDTNSLPNNIHNVKMASETILNNSGILERIVGFLGKAAGFNIYLCDAFTNSTI